MPDLRDAHDLFEMGEYDAANGICVALLNDQPDNIGALSLLAGIALKAERTGVAVAYFDRCVNLRPQSAVAWNNLGTAWHEARFPAKARECFKRALSIEEKPLYYVNLGVTYADEGNHVEALKWIRKAERMAPDLINVPAALCFSELAVGDWANGWKHYEATLGGKFRKHLDFAPDWDGRPVDKLIVYGEQGLGDEIMYASCLADVREKAKQVVIECDPRLEGLYARSFPWAEVHGTRRLDREWDTKADAQVACGSLPSLFRPSPDSCPRTPYLTADPERRLMWRALFKSWGKPVIGIAWSGGRATSQAKKRHVGLDAFRPLIEARDAVFVSLQYKDPSEEIAASGLPVRHFPALLSQDYDDTAALVAELDEIVGIHTTVHHLAGAMGKASTILVPHAPLAQYCYGDGLPWYADQKYHRQRKDEAWVDCVRRLV